MAALLRQKRLVWGLILGLVTVVTCLSYISGRRFLAAVHAVEHTLRFESAINETLSLLKDAETGQRGFILTADRRFLEPYDAALRALPRQIDRLATITGREPDKQKHVQALRGLIDAKLSYMAETIRVRTSAETLALARVRAGEGKLRMDRIRALCRTMLDEEEAELTQRKREAEQAEEAALWGVGIGSLLTLVFALFSFFTVHRDVEELKRAAEELAASEEHYRLLTEYGSDLVRLLSGNGAVLYVSPSVERVLGYGVDEYMQLAPRSLMHPDELAAAVALLEEIRTGARSEGVSTYRLRHKSGDYRWFEVHWTARRNVQGALLDIHSVGRDVTERLAAERKLSEYADELRGLSLHDELTGLYNRRGFVEVAGHAHARAQADGRAAAVVFVDLNDMKRINDEQGHDIGDLALKDAADTLRATLREADILARLGGDEFVAFALDLTSRDLEGLRARMREQSDQIVTKRARTFRLSMSLGAAYLEPGAARTLTDLLELADAAMYEQKNARRARGGVSNHPPARPGDA